MSTNSSEIVLAFNGAKKLQTAASKAFDVMRLRGAFMSENSAIRVSLDDLAAFIEVTPAVLSEAAAANPEIFAIETTDAGTFLVTTREGRTPTPNVADANHTFQARLMTPEPKPAPRPRPVREVVRANQGWATYIGETFGGDDLDEDFGFAEPVVEVEQTVIAEPEPVVEAPVVEVAPEVEEEPTPVEAVIETPVVEEIIVEEVAAEPVVEEVQPTVENVRPEIPVFEEVVRQPTPTRSLGEPTDFSDTDADAIADALESQFSHHAHVAFFGGRWMTTDRAHRLSRGNIRDIRQYIEEQEQPLTDEMLVEDVLRVRPSNPEYANTVFGLNYWLGRERDFEFVGTRDQRFWSVTDLPALGTTLKKPNDIGSDYRFLTDGVDPESVAHRSITSVDHTISFYEWNLGLLPYDEEMQKLFPAPMLPDQRSAVFTFEIPQSYTTYLVELRYPTPTRGGFILGLDDLYFDSLVPGAIISISATENDGHYKVEYLAASEQSGRLLEVDDKRPRYHFRPTTYACAVDDTWLLSEDRFPNLAGAKPLTDRERRKLATVLEMTFERVGIPDGDSGYLASFEDLLAAINIERPVSTELLRNELELHSDITGDDANGYTYAAG
ncbi:MAG: hypothetical protein M9950_07260 [Thermomicrobiales bacterium]|nr:hypothetical protein [Thermomicrobiales bacterium]MCO5217339.1 hypothetical protein [Thermomicrobiales bacterium]